MDRVILHCDMNSFFASVELLDHPELKGRPAAVCGDPASRHGIILAKNEQAKAAGVQTAETIWQARWKCPELALLPSRHEKYRAFSKQINHIYLQYTDLVEPFSIDESWLDISGSMHLFGGDPVAIANEIRARVREETGLTLSAGVSFNKVFAKLGSDYKKPDATTVIFKEDVPSIVWPLPVTALLFVGRAAKHTLAQYGVETIGGLAAMERDTLYRLLGKMGLTLSDYARGLDNAPVVPASRQGPPKSIGRGFTFPENLVHPSDLRSAIDYLSDDVAARLRRHDRKAATVQLQIRTPDFHTISRQEKLPLPTYLAREISAAAQELCRKYRPAGTPVRMLTVTAQNLIPPEEASQQLDLFAPQAGKDRDKLESLEKTMDRIRARYGKTAITSAAQSGKPPLGHG